MERWVARTKPRRLTVVNTPVSIGTGWADFADQLVLSKVSYFHFEGCAVEAAEEGTPSQPGSFVDHIDSLLNDVFSVVVSPSKGKSFKCSVFRRRSSLSSDDLLAEP
jgi:hypothetical protein